MPDWLKIVIPSVIGLLATALAAFLSARWGMRRAFQERWWEKKERAYAEIIESLYDAIRYSDLAASDDMHGVDTARPQIEKKNTEAYLKIQKATDIGAFVISPEAAAVLRDLRESKGLDPSECARFEVMEAKAKRYRAALEKIRVCALKDLRV